MRPRLRPCEARGRSSRRSRCMLAARFGTPQGNLLDLPEAAEAALDSLSPAEADILVDVKGFLMARFRGLQLAAGSAAGT